MAQRVARFSTPEEPQSKVKVLIRIRPFIGNEGNQNKCVVHLDKENQGVVFLDDPRRLDGALQYSFDKCFDSASTQDEIFKQEIEGNLTGLLKGLNTTIFCTGMTGAGKTHTMQGTKDDPGIIPRTIQHVLNMTKGASLNAASSSEKSKLSSKKLASSDSSSSATMSYFEIYNEKVYDLLEPKEQECPVREDFNHKIVIAGLKECPIQSFNDFTTLYDQGLKNRKTAATKLNHVSSRSHALLMVRITTQETSEPFRNFESKLFLIDLAGNEDNRKTDNKGARMTESVNINSSLLALAKVVQALNDGEKRIPYRESKLTRLLQDSLGGTSIGIMIANVAPGITHFLNTYNTLNFATKSRQVVNCLQYNSIVASSSENIGNTSPLPTNSQVDRRQALEVYKESKQSKTSYPQSSPVTLTAGGSTTEIQSELERLKKEHAEHKEHKQAQTKINESNLQRIAQLEKALLQKSTIATSIIGSSCSNSSTNNFPKTSSATIAPDATPCTKTKAIHLKIAKAKNMEILDSTEALQLYSEILSQLQGFGSDYAQVSAKVQARIDHLLAKSMDASDQKFGSKPHTGSIPASVATRTAVSSKNTALNTQPAGSKSNFSQAKIPAVQLNKPALPNSIVPRVANLPVRQMFTLSSENRLNQQANPNASSQNPKDQQNPKKRKADELITSQKEDEEFMVDEADDMDIDIEASPMRRPAKKKKLPNPSDSANDEAKAKIAIEQELSMLPVSPHSEMEKILRILNSGDIKAIMGLHGIGKVRAEQIASCTSETPFTALEQLCRAGLGIRLLITFVRRNIVEAAYFHKTVNTPGTSLETPLVVNQSESFEAGSNAMIDVQ